MPAELDADERPTRSNPVKPKTIFLPTEEASAFPIQRSIR